MEQEATATWWIVATDGELSAESDQRWTAIIPYSSAPGLWSGPPTEFDLGQNQPNPFNISTAIPFAVPKPSRVSIGIYDLAGRQVATLVDGTFAVGYHTVAWNAEGFRSGIYIVMMEAGEFRSMRRVVLVK